MLTKSPVNELSQTLHYVTIQCKRWFLHIHQVLDVSTNSCMCGAILRVRKIQFSISYREHRLCSNLDQPTTVSNHGNGAGVLFIATQLYLCLPSTSFSPSLCPLPPYLPLSFSLSISLPLPPSLPFSFGSSPSSWSHQYPCYSSSLTDNKRKGLQNALIHRPTT